MERYVCIHGHFYQPPRENPWLEDIERQDSAYPYHNWNERITSECYAPNTASRILDRDMVIDIINNYSKISFNFGPTLLSWMEKYKPEVYRAIIEADKKSMKNFSGHGSAIAQAYNHMIMPLASTRDKRDQIIWGIEDFRYRFGRRPEGMWLPETAVDSESLDIMAECGIRFTILAPHQAAKVRKIGDKKWKKVDGGQIDPKRPYACLLPSGRSINLFFYDGPVSHDIAFSGLLKDGVSFADRITGIFHDNGDKAQLAHIATDGESYGHHHAFGEMALTYCLSHIESQDLAKLTIYGEFLDKFPPLYEVEIAEKTSWSCAHGVERWRSDCGCRIGSGPGWHQKWRKPLRQAMDWLRNQMGPIYEKEMSSLMKDPWKAREAYISVILNRSVTHVEKFLAEHSEHELTKEEKIKALKLLEMQRHGMLMHTSCGWFFDEISGIETTQIMQYAARCIQLARQTTGAELEKHFVKILSKAPSNIPELKNGEGIWRAYIQPSVVDLLRVGAHFGVSSLFEDYPEEDVTIYCYTTQKQMCEREEAGRQRLVIGKAHIFSHITWEEKDLCFAFLHFGDHNLNGGVVEEMKDEVMQLMHQEVKEAFLRSDLPETVRAIDKHFGAHSYSLYHLFRDEQRKVMDQILEGVSRDVEAFARQIYENYYPVMQVMKTMRMPLSKALSIPIGFIVNVDICQLLKDDELDLDHLEKLTGEVNKWSFDLQKDEIRYLAAKKISDLLEELEVQPEDISLMGTIVSAISVLNKLPVDNNFSKAQNLYFFMGRKYYEKKASDPGNEVSQKWVGAFDELGRHLRVKIT